VQLMQAYLTFGVLWVIVVYLILRSGSSGS
jgi:hypothetical protein